jgi:hypothetical protein
MNDTPKRAFGASAKSKKPEITVDLPTARHMLPLVKSIVRDIVDTKKNLSQLHPEQESLERHRRELNWKERERRYRIDDEIAAAEKSYKSAISELRGLGVDLIDGDHGRVAFHTRINGRPAVFTWQQGEDNVGHWNYEDEEQRRPIPNEWIPGTPLRLKGK